MLRAKKNAGKPPAGPQERSGPKQETFFSQRDYAESLIKAANVLVVGLDLKGKVRLFNETAERLTGYAAAEMEGRSWFEILAPKDRYPEVWKAFREFQKDGRIPRDFENPILTRSGEERHISWQNAELNKDGRSSGTLSFGIDITERKKDEAQILRLNRLYATLVQVNEAIVRSRSRQGLFQAICRIAVEYGKFRFAWVGLINPKDRKVLPVAHGGNIGEDLAVIRASAEDETDGRSTVGTSIRKDRCDFCNNVQSESRMAFWHWLARKWGFFSSASVPIRLQGRIIGALSVYAGEPDFFGPDEVELLEQTGADISFALDLIEQENQRREAEEALRDSEERYRVLVEGLPDIVFLVDRDGRIAYANSAGLELFGRRAGDILGKKQEELFDLETAERHSRIFREVFAAGAPVFDIGPEWLKKVGRWIETRLIPVKDKNGNVSSILGVVRDVTAKKKVEDEVKESYDRLKGILDGTVNALASTIEKRDPYTSGHQTRVTRLACAIARELGLSPEKVEAVRVAGLLHDIGKVNIPSEVLGKPGALSDPEMDLLRTHVRSGYEIIKSIPFVEPIAEIILQHHERLNGSGYPAGLAGEETLLEAKIIAVADTVEAMASHRPYRAALGIGKALTEISRNKGVLYDGGVVESCLRVFVEKKFSFG